MPEHRPARNWSEALPFIVFLFLVAAAIAWLRLNTHLPLWADLLIVLPQTVLILYALAGWIRGDESPPPVPRKYETLTFLACGLITLRLAFSAGAYLFLIYLYGLARVQREKLRFLSTPKGHAWPVSNGDQIVQGQFLHYLMTLGIWFALFFLIFPVVYRRLPVKRPAAPVRREV